MQTNFSAQQLRQPDIAAANAELRKCVHCGFCMATCPTYVLSGNELEGPRGRIYAIKTLLEENETAPPWEVLSHLDRCLTCLSCVTTCPSGVDYERLIDIARAHVGEAPTRPFVLRLVRRALLAVVPERKRLFALMRLAGPPARWLAPLLERIAPDHPLAALARGLAESRPEHPPSGDFPPLAQGPGGGRKVALLTGCMQAVMGRRVSEATLLVLRMAGFHVVIPPAAGCCGAMELHMGARARARERARANLRAWSAAGVEAVVIDASGCAGTVKNYGTLLADDAVLEEEARWFSANAFELSELLLSLPERPRWRARRPRRVVWDADAWFF